ncbi:MAG: hypothetical protein M5R36_01895 [Deltaproteobacteria bacterium]|nr:hypothetical protein [Deltaproteobacteria bacterium]
MTRTYNCSACGNELLLGAVRYDVHIRIASAFDGYLPDAGDDAGERERKISTLLENLETISQEDLEKEVFQEIDLYLCAACRRRFLESLSDLTGGKYLHKGKQPALLQ